MEYNSSVECDFDRNSCFCLLPVADGVPVWVHFHLLIVVAAAAAVVLAVQWVQFHLVPVIPAVVVVVLCLYFHLSSASVVVAVAIADLH